jgi:hypothetical protein
VAPAAREGHALGQYGKITVIAPVLELANQWAEYLPPNTTFITPLMWLRRADDRPDDLIICDELSQWSLNQIEATLRNLPCDVWLVNPHDITVHYTMQMQMDPANTPPGRYTCKIGGITETDGGLSVTFVDVKTSS